MTVGELNARVSSAELTEWQAFLRVEHEEREERSTMAKLEADASTGLQRRKKRMMGAR